MLDFQISEDTKTLIDLASINANVDLLKQLKNFQKKLPSNCQSPESLFISFSLLGLCLRSFEKLSKLNLRQMSEFKVSFVLSGVEAVLALSEELAQGLSQSKELNAAQVQAFYLASVMSAERVQSLLFELQMRDSQVKQTISIDEFISIQEALINSPELRADEIIGKSSETISKNLGL